jgi:8-amino-7-oxononanoate synthase
MGTLSKAAGAAGAYIGGHPSLVEWLMQRMRSYLFATAAPAMVTEALRASVRRIEADDWRRARLRAHAARLHDALADLPKAGRLLPSTTAIQALIIGDNGTALERMARLWREGLWVPAIRPPTVPAGTARLRISLSAAHEDADLERLIDALRRCV